jgi:hypothetical protein
MMTIEQERKFEQWWCDRTQSYLINGISEIDWLELKKQFQRLFELGVELGKQESQENFDKQCKYEIGYEDGYKARETEIEELKKSQFVWKHYLKNEFDIEECDIEKYYLVVTRDGYQIALFDGHNWIELIDGYRINDKNLFFAKIPKFRRSKIK